MSERLESPVALSTQVGSFVLGLPLLLGLALFGRLGTALECFICRIASQHLHLSVVNAFARLLSDHHTWRHL